MSDNDTADLRTLVEQVHAGVLLMEERLDAVGPSGSWIKSGTPERYAWGQLSMAWINLVTVLLEDPNVQTWEIEPLVTRSADGGRSGWSVGPDRHVIIEPWDGVAHPDLARTTSASVRPVNHPTEPRYTLAEAREILAICQTHRWDVETDDGGQPVGIKCANCDEKRPLR